jgi:hypothetical protein
MKIIKFAYCHKIIYNKINKFIKLIKKRHQIINNEQTIDNTIDKDMFFTF